MSGLKTVNLSFSKVSRLSVISKETHGFPIKGACVATIIGPYEACHGQEFPAFYI